MPLDNPIGMFIFIVGGVLLVGFVPMLVWQTYELVQAFRHPERPYYGRYSNPLPPPPPPPKPRIFP